MRKLWVFLAAGVLLACACPSIPLITIPAPTDSPQPVEPRDPAVPVTHDNLTVTQLNPQDGDLAGQLQQEASKASVLGQHMFVEFDASW